MFRRGMPFKIVNRNPLEGQDVAAVFHGHMHLFFFISFKDNGSTHEILLLIEYEQMPSCNYHAGVPSGARGLKFALSLHLHPFVMYASSEGSGETVRMHRLV